MSALGQEQVVRYVVDANGQRTDVVVPIAAWQTLIAAWERMIEQLEDQEDRKILQDWLVQRTNGHANTTSLDAFEQELHEDGLLPG